MRLFLLAIFTAILLTSKASIAEFDAKVCGQILRSTENHIDCQLGFLTNPQEREELIKGSYGIIRHIACTIHLNIPKNQVANALFGAGKVTLSPHQIDCGIQTNGDPFKIGLTLAPWIQFDNDGVSDIRLNIGNVTGVPAFIGKLIVKYGNAPELQADAKDALNKFIANL